MNIETIIHQMRNDGERITPQRRHVIEALCANPHQHFTINDIGTVVAANHPGAQMSEPTIYRILQWLKDGYWVAQTDMANTGTVYQLVSDPPHHHLICLSCSQVQSVEDELFTALRASLLEKHGFRARLDHMAVYGLCDACYQNSTHNPLSERR